MADWKPFPEDPRERAQFERGVQMCDGDVRRHIAHALRIWAAVHSGGSYAEQCQIMANEVMKLELPTPDAAGVVANEETHPNNRLLFKDMCRFFGIELGKDNLVEARAKIDARGVSLVDGESSCDQTPIPSPMDSEREG